MFTIDQFLNLLMKKETEDTRLNPQIEGSLKLLYEQLYSSLIYEKKVLSLLSRRINELENSNARALDIINALGSFDERLKSYQNISSDLQFIIDNIINDKESESEILMKDIEKINFYVPSNN